MWALPATLTATTAIWKCITTACVSAPAMCSRECKTSKAISQVFALWALGIARYVSKARGAPCCGRAAPRAFAGFIWEKCPFFCLYGNMLLLFSQIVQILNLHLFKSAKVWYSKSKFGVFPILAREYGAAKKAGFFGCKPV